MLTSLRRLAVTVTGRRDDVSSRCRRSVSSREHAIDGGFSLSCPLCGTRVAGNRVMLNKHIRSQHSPLITSQLTLDPETTYSAIFGRPPKRTNVKELRFGEGLAVTRKGPWRGFWYDFAESRGGGPIEAILKAASSEMTYAEAAVKAAALAGIDYQSAEGGSRTGEIRAREKELISEIAQHTERKLQEESRAKSLRVETARNIWEAGVPIKDTLGEAYLVDHRGIPPDVLSRLSLQFLEPGAAYVEFDVMGMKQKKVNNGPALLVPVEDHQGNLCGVQRIYVDPKTGGKPANGTTKHKFSLGSVAGNGGVVQRGSCGGDVIVAEGPETCASLAAVSPSDAWVVAALSVGNFANLAKYITSKKPESRVIFAGDNDSADPRVAGMFFRNCNAAAAEIRSTWRPVKVVTARPDTDGADWNDVLVTEGREALTTQFWGKVNRKRCDEEIL